MRFSVFKLVLVISVSLALLFYLADSLEKNQEELEIEVERAYDLQSTGTVSKVGVSVENQGDREVEPVFMMVASKSNNHAWNSGAGRLAPGERKTFNLTPDRSFQKFPVNQPFRVRVNARKDHLYKGLSSLHVPEPCMPAIRDPAFTRAPYSGIGYTWDRMTGNGNITYNNRSLVFTAPKEGETIELLLRQSIHSIPRELEVEFSTVTENTVLDNDTGEIARGGGIVLFPSRDRKLWIAYSEDYRNRTVVEGGRNELVILTPSLESSFDIRDILEEQGWKPGHPPYELYIGTVSDGRHGYRMGLERVHIPGCRENSFP